MAEDREQLTIHRVHHPAGTRVADPEIIDDDDDLWFRVLNSLVASKTWAKLKGASKGVLIVLYRFQNAKERKSTGRLLAWPSLQLMAEYAGVSRRSAVDAVNELKHYKLIREDGLGPKGTVRYELIAPRVRKASEKSTDLRSPGKQASLVKSSALGKPTSRVKSASLEQGSGSPESREVDFPQNRLNQEDQVNRLADLLISQGVSRSRAEQLAADVDADTIELRVKDFETRLKHNERITSGFLISSILNDDDYGLHPATAKVLKRQAENATRSSMQKVDEEMLLDQRLYEDAEAAFNSLSQTGKERLRAAVLETDAAQPSWAKADLANPTRGLKAAMLHKIVERMKAETTA